MHTYSKSLCEWDQRVRSTTVTSANKKTDTGNSRFRFKLTVSRGLRGLTPASDVLRLRGRVGAFTPSGQKSGRPLASACLMTSAGSRPPVLLDSCSISWILTFDWQNVPLMWWIETSDLQKKSTFWPWPTTSLTNYGAHFWCNVVWDE